MTNKTSPHILGTAANLLGFCLVVISSLHLSDKVQKSLVDEFASVIALLLAASCLLSFSSLRRENSREGKILERLADQLFFLALAGIFGIVLYLTIRLWNS